MGLPRRILLIKLGSIGDVVHTLPALTDLKASFPEAEVDWLVETKSRSILEGNRQIHEVIEADTQRWRQRRDIASLREIWRVVSKLRARKYDLAFDFQGLWKSAAFGYFSGARQLIGFDRRALKEPGSELFYDTKIQPRPEATHVVDLYKELLHGVGVVSRPHVFDLHVGVEDERYIAEQLALRSLDDFVILNPGGGWETKTWPPENYALLHGKLTETGLKSVVTWGPGEEALAQWVCDACPEPRPATFPTTIPQLTALLRRAKLFIGGDTGPLHIAAACRTPIVGIFGPTDPLRNGPFSPADIVVSHRVPCGPCYKRACEIYEKQCLRLIQVQEVYEAALRRLKMKNPLPVL
jgi:heptosyltransferase I